MKVNVSGVVGSPEMRSGTGTIPDVTDVTALDIPSGMFVLEHQFRTRT